LNILGLKYLCAICITCIVTSACGPRTYKSIFTRFSVEHHLLFFLQKVAFSVNGIAYMYNNRSYNNLNCYLLTFEHSRFQVPLCQFGQQMLYWQSFSAFTGGVSLVSTITKQQYTENYSGCISDIYLQDKGPLRVPEDAIRGFNVRPCLNKK
jgi:hypothetical protein